MSVFLIRVITRKNTKCDGGLNMSLKWTVESNRVLSMPLLLLLTKKKKKVDRLGLNNNTQSSSCGLHAGNICYSNFATISGCVHWDPVSNTGYTGFELFLHLAFCPTANEQLRACLQVLGFLWMGLGRCPSELGDVDRCGRLASLTNAEWASILQGPLIRFPL